MTHDLARKPQPGLGMAFVWMIGYWTFTQIPGGALALVWALVAMFRVEATPEDWERWSAHPFELPGLGTGLLVGMGIAQLLGVFYSVILMRNLIGRDWARQTGLSKGLSFGHLLGIALVIPGMLIAANALVAFSGKPEVEGAGEAASVGLQVGRQVLEDFQKILAGWPSWAAVLVVAVGPALAEEFFCRGFLGHGLLARHGVAGGVILTSLLFGIMHLVPIQAIYAALLGLMLHGLRLATGSLWAPILAHFGNNALSVLGACDDSPLKEPLNSLEAWIQVHPPFALVVGLGMVLVAFAFLNRIGEKRGEG